MPKHQQLTYLAGHWFLQEVSGLEKKYERVSIRFAGGIFMLLKLTGISPEKTVVVFYDQMMPEEYRLLRFINYALPVLDQTRK